MPAAINGSAWAIFHNQGQACIAGSRLVLHEHIADEFLDRFTTLARSIRAGNPLDAATEMGPLTSAQHRDRVLSYVEVAREQGGEVLAGGRPPADAALARGCRDLGDVLGRLHVAFTVSAKVGRLGQALRAACHRDAVRSLPMIGDA